ncbi:MAG: 3-(cis-5,6-dihydroxycyclohexa-1,3-dien-1-yl)propanoate dehydrogenase [Candidatus Binataceae bacterium]|nr:3-(cis-5,6-dihydroxycyclohexa-1,3-dien-1-yl)propanoate dehydrogenase [Candidatus Binataceae bacterium]
MGILDKRVVLVTGGASGLGRAIVTRFVREGAKVGVLDRSEDRCRDLARENPDSIATIVGDVRSFADNQRAVRTTVEQFGRLDSFIGNAGIWDHFVTLVKLPPDRIEAAFDEVFGINVKGYVLGAKAAVPELIKTSGNMIFTVSNAGFYVAGGGPLYTASKHAVVGLIRQLAFELAPKVRVNGVAPGAIASDLRGPKSLGLENASVASIPMGDLIANFVPLGKFATPDDYTPVYLLLASNEQSGTMTGSVVNCDGGIGVRGFPDAAGGRDL